VQQLRSDGNATPVLLMTKPFRLLDFGDRLLRLLADQVRSATSASSHPSLTAERAASLQRWWSKSPTEPRSMRPRESA
jgi:hypothetical protein